MPRKRILPLIVGITIVVAGIFASTSSFVRHASAQTAVNLQVVSARTEPRALGGTGVFAGDPVTDFKYIINVDNTGTTEQRSPADGCSPEYVPAPGQPGYPESCHWVSIAGVPGSSPIYTQGNQSDFAGGTGVALEPGRYLISVMADGYKLDGVHFTVDGTTPNMSVTVELQPTPLPDATIQAFIFEDISPTNGAPDVPVEHGLAGFVGHLADYLGEVTTDVYGNPFCTTYVGEDPVTHEIPLSALDADMLPVVDQPGLNCVSDADGYLVIPHMGTNRYALSAVPPDGENWIQTTTLEGNHDWDAWVMEGATGLDTEFVVAGEPFPVAIFGFVHPTNSLPGGPNGHIRGVVEATKVYVPPKGGTGLPGTIWGGLTGARLDKPIENPWISLTDLNNGDTAIYVGQGDANGAFDIANVPDGNYTITWWDEPQNYILDLINVTVANGETVDLGILPLTGWWTRFDGYVFNDLNRNGVKDVGEPGIPNFALTMRKRENSLMDRGATAVATDPNGYYIMENAYPMTQWLVMEAYNDLYYTTGITFQADNQSTPTTILGAGVDVSVLPIIGLSGRLDWGVHFYDATGATNGLDPRNGGIVGTVSYDTTRNELDARYAFVEDWQPGISNLTVNLYEPVACGTTGTPCDSTGRYELSPDGSYTKGKLLNAYLTESWERPGQNGDGTQCIPRDVDGNPLAYPADQQVTSSPTDCLEGPMMGVQFQANFSNVDGNYGFGDGCFNGTLDATDPSDPVCVGGSFDPLPGGRDYLVEVEIPNDALGRPMYMVTREEDINVGNGDQFVPQVPPPACVGALHTVDVSGIGTDGYPAVDLFGNGSVVVPASTPTVNQPFVDMDGSPFEGMVKPLCDTKLVPLNNGRSIVPTFNLFTDVPLPSRFWGLIVDDLNFSSNPQSLLYGEKAGVPFAPVGIYDFANRLVATAESDFNGLFDVLLPSSNRINCPTPSGVCANLYRLVGNDPGVPGQLNPNYNPQFRTIAAEFEAIPGLLVPADLAPTQVGVTVQVPGGQVNPISCSLDSATPQLFAVSQPYVNNSGDFTIDGNGFGVQGPGSQVMLDGTALSILAWSDTQITVNVSSSTPFGPHQLNITVDNGQSTINGLTFHVLRGAYNPNLYEVGPGRTYATIQSALDAAAASTGDDLVVVYPGQPDLTNPRANPRGAYYENLIISTPVKLQGVGPGGFQGATFVPGSVIDGGAFAGDGTVAADWYTTLTALTWDGNQTIYDGAVISIFTHDGDFTSAYNASIDGFDLRGGDQQGFPGNINAIGGGPTGLPANLITQGGAIFANGYARYLQITNNTIQNNGGAYGTVRLGNPDLPAPDTNAHNENVRIAHNRVIANGGTNLAGGIGIFAGADNYEVAYNDICGNFSAEYGGGLTVYGRSPNGTIHDNRIYFNRSYDEGGGIMIAGELPADPNQLSPGSGPVNIYNNLIQSNLSNDDGGGLRFLMAGGPGGVDVMNVYNNMIVNNISTHEGGGIGINDTPTVNIFNNTIMKNLTTATAVTSTGVPAPAGLSTSQNSDLLQATLPGSAPIFSNPLLFNNIFWDNRAGSHAGTTVTGLGIAGDATPINNWDMGVADGTGLLAPTNSILQVTTGTTADASNISADPAVISAYDTSVSFAAWRTNPAFIGAILVTVELPPNLMGDYHIPDTSPAHDLGAASRVGVNAPEFDIDNQGRPADAGFDSGADEANGIPITPPTPPTSTSNLRFSTSGNGSLPGVTGPYDDADIYTWDGTTFSREIDATVLGLPSGANVDGLEWIDATHFYVSFSGDVSAGGGTVQDEDVIYYDNGTVSVYFDGTALGLNAANSQDPDAISIVNGVLYFSTTGNGSVPGVAGPNDNADIYAWDGTAFSRVIDATAIGLPGGANVDGLQWVDTTHFYLSFSGDTSLSGLGTVPDEDVVYYDNGVWSMYFDATAQGLTANSQDLDAISIP
ncbi:MAG: IPT/TIG domain-containing protein [Ardenticatenaceae bacterium]|nr:IPT/TIG domain-containing protein [Ardenticatenaceae bacterium]MCB9445204.1 IPT/TIG domain-containing protein [Ardenticatenaceae bacterium]